MRERGDGRAVLKEREGCRGGGARGGGVERDTGGGAAVLVSVSRRETGRWAVGWASAQSERSGFF